ncbi:MAG: phosphoribosylanthranilate isomerase [Proteobacteria bacterium]|nr:phosphoribosylanthranilate isomerase [Pseudomonadota bacterium]
MRTRVKICCIASIEEAQMAIRYGADAVGLVGPMPSGPGVVDLDTIARIARAIPPPIASFLLSSETNAAGLIAQARRCNPTVIQIVDAVDGPAAYIAIRRACPGIKIVQVVHVTGNESLSEARAIAPHVDSLLLDSGNPNLAIKELGGTGRVHDWAMSAAIVRAVNVPVFLAGGLSADNVAKAIAEVRPYGLDLCSNLRRNGALDETRLAAFMGAVRAA